MAAHLSVFHVVTFVRAIDHRSVRGQRRHIVLGSKQVTEERSHEKASNHRNNAHWQHDALRCPFVSAFLASDCRFGRAGYGGCTGRAAGDPRQRRRCGAQICTALRRWRYLLISRAACPWRSDGYRFRLHSAELRRTGSLHPSYAPPGFKLSDSKTAKKQA